MNKEILEEIRQVSKEYPDGIHKRSEAKEILSFKEDSDYKKLSIEDILLLKEYIEKLEEKTISLQDTLKLRDNISNYIKDKNNKALEYARTHRTTFDINKMINILEGSDKE